MRSRRILLIISLVGTTGLLVVLMVQLVRPLLLGSVLSQAARTPAAKSVHSPVPSLRNLTEGFSIESNAEIINAANDGIETTLIYGYTPSENNNSVGETLKANNMKVIDELPWEYLYYYECHIHRTCSLTTYPELTSVQAVLNDVTVHLKRVRSNSLVIGYWILDDWAYEPGSGKDLLIQVNSLIHQYTPGKPSICGFGGEVRSPSHTIFNWGDSRAANFSPRGCDMIGLYIYAPSLPNTTPMPSVDSYDWSMSTTLPAMFASLQQRGWNIKNEPLIGIGQAFGGPIAHEDRYWVTPNAKDIEIQSKGFCEHGATGLAFYSWNDSEYGPATQTPMNNSEIEQGIRNSIAVCKKYWSNHP